MSATAILAAFPRRSLSLSLTRAKQPLAAIVFMLGLAIGFAGGGVWALASWLPDILVDRAVGASGAVVQGRVSSDCSRGSRGRFLSCDFTITVAGADKQTRTTTQSLLIAAGPERLPAFMRIRQDPANPARVGTEFGYEHLTSRWFALGLLAGGMFALAGLCVGAIIYGRVRINRRQAIAEAALPAIVAVRCAQRNNFGSAWDAHWHDGQVERRSRLSLEAGQEPFWADPANGQALALLGEAGRALLLDGSLSLLALTDAERQALWRASEPSDAAYAVATPVIQRTARAA
jgi:hypothetical protein